MERTQWDKKIKDLLEQRTLQPSEGAWEKLSRKIPAKRSRKFRNYRRYGMAAAIAGLLLLSVLFIRTNERPVQQQVQSSEVEPTLDTEIKKREMLASPEKQPAVPFVADTGKQPDKSNLSAEETISLQVERSLATTESDIQATSADPADPKPNLDATEEQLIQAKIDELVAEVNSRETEEGTLAESEVDSLLRAAQQDILLKHKAHTTQSVDAMVLLSEVETELDRSFRDQLFDKLKAGYIKVRTALADRNN